MKLKRKSGLISAVVALSCASFVSVGFAAWVISQGDQATVSGTFSVETVSNKSHLITSVQSETGNAFAVSDTTLNAQVYTFANADVISFGAPAGHDNSDKWLTNTNGTAEHLSVSFSFVVTNVTTAPAANTMPACVTTFALAVTGEGKATVFDGLVTSKIIKQLPSLANGGIVTSSELVNENKDCKITATITFAWGDWFSADHNSTGSNPFTYYNGLDATNENVADAQAKLTALAGLDGAGYQLSIVTTADA